MFLRKHKGQSILEYAILIAIIIAAILIMQTFMKRGVQGRLKDSSDRISGGDSFSASDSTIIEDRAMTQNRNIHDETATNGATVSVMSSVGFAPAAADLTTSGVGEDAYTGSAVTGGTTRSLTQSKMSGSGNESYSTADQAAVAGNATSFTGATAPVATDVFTGGF